MMRRIVRKVGGDIDITRDYEYTDWEDVADFARTLIQVLNKKAHCRVPVARRFERTTRARSLTYGHEPCSVPGATETCSSRHTLHRGQRHSAAARPNTSGDGKTTRSACD